MFYVPIDDLLDARDWSCYDLAQRVSAFGISTQTVYRFCRVRGAPKRFDMRLLGALCEVFDMTPGQLLRMGTPPKKPKVRKRTRKRSA